MSEQDEFFLPEEVDRQIERVRQFKAGDRLDAEAMAYLHSHYQTDARQEQEALNRIWNRIADAPLFAQTTQESEKELSSMQHPQAQYHAGAQDNARPGRARRTLLIQRLGTLAAALILVALVGSMTMFFYAARQNKGGNGAAPYPTGTVATSHVPLKVTSVTMAVTPESIAGKACGTNVTVTYTATIHVVADGPGGTVKFNYTINNGRGQTPASIHFNPGETTKTYAFTWKGALPTDHTYPGLGGIQVTSPNQLTSPLVAPTGQCGSAAAFLVTKIEMKDSPSSIQGLACGKAVVVTYTATIHVAANGPGGTVRFSYTINNGRGQTPANVHFNPGETSKSYTFTWSGALPADHTYPGLGGIQVTSPNQLTSPMVAPTGTCG